MASFFTVFGLDSTAGRAGSRRCHIQAHSGRAPYGDENVDQLCQPMHDEVNVNDNMTSVLNRLSSAEGSSSCQGLWRKLGGACRTLDSVSSIQSLA